MVGGKSKREASEDVGCVEGMKEEEAGGKGEGKEVSGCTEDRGREKKGGSRSPGKDGGKVPCGGTMGGQRGNPGGPGRI